GTAYGRRILKPEFAMAGKTGTSQVRKILKRGQDQDELPWEYRHHAWFVGYAPLDKPRYAAALIVEHGGSGGAAAGPHIRDILTKAQEWKSAERNYNPAPAPEIFGPEYIPPPRNTE
ncbi:MAG: penicillin-binding transpeptidase domain-containing protein, partial [Rickettsiales bacterium]